VYGDLPAATDYPVCVFDLWWVDKPAFDAARVRGRPLRDVGGKGNGALRKFHRSIKVGDFYHCPWNYYTGFWIAHTLHHGQGTPLLGGNTWIEVKHQSMPGEKVGLWFAYAPGTGIWYNTGRIQHYSGGYAVKVALDAVCAPTKVTLADVKADPYHLQLVRCARAKGNIDTIQLLNIGWERPNNAEVLSIHLDGRYSCGLQGGGTEPGFRAGWLARRPCSCDPKQRRLNCNG